MSIWVIGIDPGASGGMAVFDASGGLKLYPFETPGDAVAVLQAMPACTVSQRVVAYLERVGSMPGQGVASTFKFGTNYGGWQWALQALGIGFQLVGPRTWQKALGVQPRKQKVEPKSHHKRRLKDLAQKLYPQERLTLRTSDALLIAEYGRRLERGGA